MEPRDALIILIPLATAAGAAIVAWMAATQRMRARLEPQIRELDRVAAAARARAEQLEGLMEPLKQEIVDQVQERVQTSVFVAFDDIRATLELSSTAFADVKKAIDKNRAGLERGMSEVQARVDARLGEVTTVLDEIEKRAKASGGAPSSETVRAMKDVVVRTEKIVAGLRDELRAEIDRLAVDVDRSSDRLEEFRWELRSGALPWENEEGDGKSR